MPDTYQLTPHERVTVVSRAPEALVVEVAYGPGGTPPPGHRHPAQDERFEVLEGTITARVPGGQRELSAGAVLEIPRGAVHRMWNAHDAPARLRWETRPAGRTEAWWAALDAAGAGSGRPGVLALAPALREYRDVFRLSAPQWLMQPLLAVLAKLGGGERRRPRA
jgi:quercetin dioxygenase-like cupin family protein